MGTGGDFKEKDRARRTTGGCGGAVPVLAEPLSAAEATPAESCGAVRSRAESCGAVRSRAESCGAEGANSGSGDSTADSQGSRQRRDSWVPTLHMQPNIGLWSHLA